MGLLVSPTISKSGKVEDQTSSYQPDDRTKQRLAQIQTDYGFAERIRNEPYEEFEFRDVIQYMNDSQRAYNSFVQSPSDDPDLAWRANTVRPITRNKVITTAAHMTADILFPTIRAQNDFDEEDKDAAVVMEDLMKYANEQSQYEKMMVQSIIAALVNPVSIIYEGYTEAYRTVKAKDDEGKTVEEEVKDEVFSGFQNLVVPTDEFYPGNAYEHEMQKQPFVIWRRFLDYNTAEIKYGNNENFQKYVSPGLRVFYVDDQDSFYEMYDEDLRERLVEEVTYYNRVADLEIRIVNGVMMDDPDRGLQRQDKNYPFVKFGYELFDEGRFFYYKSLVDKMKDDQRVIDTLYNMVIDGTFLNLMPPAVVFGSEEIDAAVIMPGAVTTMRNDTRFETIRTNNNLSAGLNAIGLVEASINESSSSPLQGGQAVRGSQTAFEVQTLERNAKSVLGLFGKMVNFMVEEFGNLRINTILQHFTVAEGVEVTGGTGRLKYRNILIPDRIVDGKKKSRHIRFSMEEVMSKEKMMEKSFSLLEEAEEKEITIAQVNPELFREMKYLVKVDADFRFAESKAVSRALNLETYDRVVNNPLADPGVALRKLVLEDRFPGETDQFLRQQPEAPEAAPEGVSSEVVSQLTRGGMPGIAQLEGVK